MTEKMTNKEIFEESKKYMPGGVNSPVRAYKDVDVTPPIIKKGEGAYLFDEEDNKYIDFVGAWGPAVLGHADPDIVRAIQTTAENGISFGSTTKLELDLAKHICTTLDNIEMVRMVNSGTEATMSAARLARGYTDRDKIVKFAGCYHGHFDAFLVSAGSGVMTEGIPGSAGVPQDIIKNTIVAKYNDIENVAEIFKTHKGEIAGVIIEPVAGNMGLVPAEPEFLKELEKLCKENGALLIFDEVMSGFRVGYKGAQALYGATPDLTTYAKVMGGGLPSGAYGGRREIMEKLSPLGPVYQAGTMSGNPIVMAAGLAALTKLNDNPQYYDYLESLAERMQTGIEKIAKEKNLPIVVNRFKSMMTIFFSEKGEVNNYEDALECDTKMYARFFKHMVTNGIFMSPSQFEAMFFSIKHTEQDVDKFLEVMSGFNN